MLQLQRLAPSLLRSTTSNASSAHEAAGHVVPELQHLTAQDIDIVDAVIERAGSSATTFFSVFKAYSEVLKERGLDPQEVVYYGKLLKLGTLKGKNWGEKWEVVKEQLGRNRPISPRTEEMSHSESENLPLSMTRLSKENTMGIHRRPHQGIPPANVGRDARRRRSSHSFKQPSEKPNDMQQIDIFHSKEDFLSSTIVHKTKSKLLTSMAMSEEDGELSSPVPPSYKSTIVEPTVPVPTATRLEGRRVPQSDSLFTGKKIVTVPKQRPKPAIDMDEAWKNIKMEQDEKFADEFRDNLLLSRCWKIWRQGYLWIVNTHQQIQDARDMLLLRLSMRKWQNRLIARQAAENRLVYQFMTRRLKRVFGVWKAKLKQKQRTAWREDMRQKMKVVKRKSEVRTKKDTWMKWQHVLLLRRAHRHYEIGLLYRYLNLWKVKHADLDTLARVANNFASNADFRNVNRFWHQWKRATTLEHKARFITRKVNCRLLVNANDRWRNRLARMQLADVFRNVQNVKFAFSRWKTAQTFKRALEHRANKYVHRKDELLLMAIVRIWRARMRGTKLQRFKETMIMQRAWQKWLYRLSKEGAQSDVANNFLIRINSRLVAATFHRWLQVRTTHQNAAAYALKYDEAHLQAKTLHAWRMRLHSQLQTAKVARLAHRFVIMRGAWQLWINAVEERKKKRKLRKFEIVIMRKIFIVWKNRAQQQQYWSQCELILRDRDDRRVVRTALAYWTNRIIDIKSRELDVAQQADAALQRAAWSKWKTCRRKHIEEISLLENYLLVKREDSLRRAFHHWLTVKRAVEHRRLMHQRKVAQIRQILLISAWERWRERFKEERLRPLEYQLIIDHQKHISKHSFDIWVSKTDALPAVRFHSRKVKQKYFKMWKNGLPNALKMNKAREFDKHSTSVRCFQKWIRVYKTKTTLKAVQRAKYLRLPTSSWQVPPISRPRPLHSGASLFPRRRTITSDDEDTHEDAVPHRRSAVDYKSLVDEEAKPDKSISRSEYASSIIRQPSPVRSTISMPNRRSPSPTSRRGPASVTETAVTSDLWDAIRKVGQPRPARRSRNR